MKKGKIAICTLPGIKGGGTFTIFWNLKVNLEPLGWEVVGITIGNIPWEAKYEMPPYGCVRVAGNVDPKANPKEAAIEYVKWCVANGVDIVVPMNSPIVTSAIPMLPPSIKVVMYVNNNPARVYKYISTFPEYVSRWIFMSQGQVNDTRKFRFPDDKIELIPLGVETNLGGQEISKGNSDSLKLGFLGRIHHAQKGVLHIPEILDALDSCSCKYTLDIVGSGQDEEQLYKLLKHKIEAGIVTFRGAVKIEEVSALVKDWDVFLMPSRFEGFGLVLIETMVWGVVPVASSIKGVTDWVVKDKFSGFLCDMRDINSFVKSINALYQDRDLLKTMSHNARTEVLERFSLSASIDKYDRAFNKVLSEPARVLPLKNWAEWKPYVEYRPPYSYLTSLFPLFIKSFIKKKLLDRTLAFSRKRMYSKFKGDL